ncbi:hypothetical protein [Nocardioides caldifontis]|nr:hypothetical protein [Nocardioides caldifontis]
MGLAFIAAVYVGFSVAGVRPRVIVVGVAASSPWSLLQGSPTRRGSQ